MIVWFQLFWELIFLLIFKYFFASSTEYFFLVVLFFLAGLHCLLRIHALNSCVGDTWRRLWRDDFTHNGKQVVNRLKIPQGLSTLMFRRWSEFPSRGGVCLSVRLSVCVCVCVCLCVWVSACLCAYVRECMRARPCVCYMDPWLLYITSILVTYNKICPSHSPTLPPHPRPLPTNSLSKPSTPQVIFT